MTIAALAFVAALIVLGLAGYIENGFGCVNSNMSEFSGRFCPCNA
jgi:hypothetical protein